MCIAELKTHKWGEMFLLTCIHSRITGTTPLLCIPYYTALAVVLKSCVDEDAFSEVGLEETIGRWLLLLQRNPFLTGWSTLMNKRKTSQIQWLFRLKIT